MEVIEKGTEGSHALNPNRRVLADPDALPGEEVEVFHHLEVGILESSEILAELQVIFPPGGLLQLNGVPETDQKPIPFAA